MPGSPETPNAQRTEPEENRRALRRRQALGLLWLALLVFVLCAVRAGRHAILLPRWWNLW
jgi:hypothetical protein